MIWQELLVGVVVLAAVLFLLRQSWRTWFSSKAGGCGGGCSCPGKKSEVNATGDKTTLVSVNELTLRLRSRT